MKLKKKRIRFVIFGQGRSGSTLLKQLLDSHPGISCEGELLNEKDNYVTNPLLRKIVYKFPVIFFETRRILNHNPVYGFTLLYYQYYPQKYILNQLHIKGWKILHIHRQDGFSQSLSHLTARHTQQWHRRTDGNIELPRLKIPTHEFLEWYRLLMKNKKKELSLLSNFSHLRVIYENDLSDSVRWQSTSEKIFNFLGVKPVSVSATLKKTYPLPYSQIIENYEELKSLAEKESHAG